MNLNRKKAPGRLTRAIVTLAARTGNKLWQITGNNGTAAAAHAKDFNPASEHYEGQLPLSERTTITVETETLLIVRSVRRSSTARAEYRSDDRSPPIDDGGN